MNYILFDESVVRQQMLPLTLTRPVAELRFGILTMRQKWEAYLQSTTSTLTESYLRAKFPVNEGEDNLLINSSFCPSSKLVAKVRELKDGEVLAKGERVVAMRMKLAALKNLDVDIDKHTTIEFVDELLSIEYPWDLFSKLRDALQDDFDFVTNGRQSRKISDTNKVIGEHNIFIEEGAQVEMAMINASKGPVYIGRDTEVMEGSIIRGPFALCDNSVLKMGAKIYGATVIGPHSKVGGEVNNSMIIGYSNKAHDGFLGNSVIGEWCNLGADTNVSNLKNTYDQVRMWSYAEEAFVNSELQFCGLIMGDHSKAGINTMFNTGTTVGVYANIFGSNFPRNYIPSFSWGGASGFRKYNFEKALQVAEKVMSRRDIELTEADRNILEYIYRHTR